MRNVAYFRHSVHELPWQVYNVSSIARYSYCAQGKLRESIYMAFSRRGRWCGGESTAVYDNHGRKAIYLTSTLNWCSSSPDTAHEIQSKKCKQKAAAWKQSVGFLLLEDTKVIMTCFSRVFFRRSRLSALALVSNTNHQASHAGRFRRKGEKKAAFS